MAKRKIELFVEINNEKEFLNIIELNKDQIICAEIYCRFFGSCTALDRLFTTIKLDWSNGKIILLKVPCEEIESLTRFRDHSEPVYMFIVRKKVTKVFRGVNCMKFGELAKNELNLYNLEQQGKSTGRTFYELNEATPDEMDFINTLSSIKQKELTKLTATRASRQAVRKRHRAELMVPYLTDLNFVLFWPHASHAHPELYEKWDHYNIMMVGREELILTIDQAKDVLYAGDAPINEASMLQLTSGRSLAICFRILDTDVNFVALVRKILYEDPIHEDVSPFKTAFEHYKSFSLTREQIYQSRREERQREKERRKESRTRRLSEMRRLAIQAREEEIESRRQLKEQRKLDLLKSGNLDALKQLEEEPDEELDPIPEELPDEIEETEDEIEVVEDEDEYFPPAGLLIPGFYAPPNDVAKANGLAILFPRMVKEHVTPQPEFLPPHILVLLDIAQRHEAIEVLKKYKRLIIHMGIFKATTPYDAVQIAFTVKQYDALPTPPNVDIILAFMVSIEVDAALLNLMDLHPSYVSRDPNVGEDECAAMFPVDYGDQYQEFEDFDDNLT